jgi:hypothetical protein
MGVGLRLPTPPVQLPDFAVEVQGSHSGSNCRVAVYQLVDYTDGLTFRRAQRWAKKLIEEEKRCTEQHICS